MSARAGAQEYNEFGRILNVTGHTVTVQFEQRDITVGDEVEFFRFKSIIDPVTGNERGLTRSLIGKGVVDEIGLGKAYITITEQVGSNRVSTSDLTLPTGSRKKMTRKVGRIQEIAADKKEMVIDLGREDEISEGDTFLIQRTENIFDPYTNQVTATNQIDVGRGKVNAVKSRTSSASITQLMPGMEIQKTDTVVFTPESGQTPPPGSGELHQLKAELDSLKREVNTLKATIDSLGNDHLLHRREFLEMKKEFEAFLPKLMSGDIESSQLVLGAAEPATRIDKNDLLTRYRRALNDCLNHRFKNAVDAFLDIIKRYPDSPLVENCRYWIAQSSFSSGDFTAAAKGFQDVLDDTRFTHKDDDASLMLGITCFQMGRTGDALDRFRHFIETYPKCEYRRKVEHWIERLTTRK